jgi:hypothetical protein
VPPNVQVLAVCTRHLPEGEHVDRRTHGGSREHESAAHLRRRGEPSQALDEDHEPEDEQGDAVRLCRQDLGAPEAEGHAAARRPLSQARRPHAQPECAGIDEHVRCVREQRERVGDERHGHFDRHESDDQRQGDRERPDPRVRVAAVPVVGVIVAHDRSVARLPAPGEVALELADP